MSKPRKEKERAGEVHQTYRKKKVKKVRENQSPAAATFSLLAKEHAVDPALSSLFAAKPAPVRPAANSLSQREAEVFGLEDPDTLDVVDDGSPSIVEEPDIEDAIPENIELLNVGHQSKRKRKRKNDEGDIEDAYMHRLALEEAEDAAEERAAKRSKQSDSVEDNTSNDGAGSAEVTDDIIEQDDEDAPPPRHETQQTPDVEIEKANSTVFLGNISTATITSKLARKNLIDHLRSFFESVSKSKDGEPKHAVESLRFRSTPYATAIPKKAAFATKQLMDATTKSTNAYAVYSSPRLAREAAKQLNGTVVLGRHLRVDEIAHPSKVDHKRCIFVGNLGFVDDESNIQTANKEEGKENRKPSKHPADSEEGLWRIFGKCGTVESVRVIRDSTTRVGKGIAYVQFEDVNAVEAALLYNEKKFPPMLPRKLRVSRAKAQKRNAKSGSGKPSSRPGINGYQRKISSAEASQAGRMGKLFGRAAAATQSRKPDREMAGGQQLSNGIKKPEAFVFEGHRASSKGGKSGLKLGGRGKKKSAKPTDRSAKRGAAFKAARKTK